MAHLRLILLCVVGSGFANAGQLDRVNKIITADLETDLEKQGISRLEFLEQLVDTFEREGKYGEPMGSNILFTAQARTFNMYLFLRPILIDS